MAQVFAAKKQTRMLDTNVLILNPLFIQSRAVPITARTTTRVLTFYKVKTVSTRNL